MIKLIAYDNSAILLEGALFYISKVIAIIETSTDQLSYTCEAVSGGKGARLITAIDLSIIYHNEHLIQR